ncbi:unnamed protein product, partial [Amoebophrya sp. A25]
NAGGTSLGLISEENFGTEIGHPPQCFLGSEIAISPQTKGQPNKGHGSSGEEVYGFDAVIAYLFKCGDDIDAETMKTMR